MSAGNKTPTKTLRNMGRLSDAQDSALDQLARTLTNRRGTRVTRADATREALQMYCRRKGVDWPAK